jgi:transcriptional regulator with XRE-family HTH domain
MMRQDNPEAFEHYRQEHQRCLGIVVRQMRTENGLTPDQLAKRAEVSALWLQKLETNQLHTNYSIGRINRIARALGVELYDVYKRADEMLGPPPWLNKEGAQSHE